jgi:hypothetical protein
MDFLKSEGSNIMHKAFLALTLVPVVNQIRRMVETSLEAVAVCTENPIRVDDVMESPKLAK